MDGQKFDTLARTITASASRRTTLRALTGGLFGGAAAVLGSNAEAATCGAERNPCERSRDCCKGLECRANGRCRYKNRCGGQQDDYCENNKDCCDGYKCRKKQNKCQRCQTRNERCSEKADCCPGYSCQNQRCREN